MRRHLGGKLFDPEWRARFALLSPKAFDPALLDLLLPAARGGLDPRDHVRPPCRRARDGRSPMELVQEALTLREAMLQLASDHLSADPVARPIAPS
jgi:hypothetical protein